MEDPHPPGSGEIACVPALKDSPSDREIVIQTVSSLARTKVLTVLPGEEIPRGQEASILGRGACAVVARNSLPPLLRRYFLSFSEGEKKFFQISNRALFPSFRGKSNPRPSKSKRSSMLFKKKISEKSTYNTRMYEISCKKWRVFHNPSTICLYIYIYIKCLTISSSRVHR